jgi:hypothetical protein
MAFHIKLKPLPALGGVLLRSKSRRSLIHESQRHSTYLAGHATFQKLVPGVEIVAMKPGVTVGN